MGEKLHKFLLAEREKHVNMNERRFWDLREIGKWNAVGEAEIKAFRCHGLRISVTLF